MYRDGGGLTVRFWGTRGSLPSPGPETSRYGGNTSCVELRAGEHLIILDAGSGLRELGNQLLRDMPITAHIFLSHYHWDHIMGFPFFGPLFAPGNTIHLYGESREYGGRMRNVLELLKGQMRAPYFPITIENEARSRLVAHQLTAGDSLKIGEATISTCRLNHPNEAMALRVEHHGRSVVYATDIEHDPRHDRALVKLAKGADALIYDSTYTDAEYAGHVGWGHSTWRAGVEIAKTAKVKQFVIFHHLPERTDREVASVERAARRVFPGALAAREGMELTYPAIVTAKRSAAGAKTSKAKNGVAKKAPKKAPKKASVVKAGSKASKKKSSKKAAANKKTSSKGKAKPKT